MMTRLAIAFAGALALTACGSDAPDQTVAEATPTEAALPTETPAMADASTPQGFVDAVAASDMFEIEAARLAQEQGKSDKIKAFAAMMIKDHTTSSDNLKKAVADAGGGLTVAPALSPVQQANLEQLRGAGENFDAMYAQMQVDAHETALGLLQAQAHSGTVDQLKSFATDTAKVVEGHLTDARKLP